MKEPGFPFDEKHRQASLDSLAILDTESEERFDRITRMARRLLNVPIALVCLIDKDRQWFKSCDGLNARETARSISFCGHAILGDAVYVIPDASLDESFADNPLVMGEPHIRFYAGCPLRHVNGSKLGTLCIIDRIPRHMSAEDIQSLKDLAALVESEFSAVQLATLDPLTDINNRRGFLLRAPSLLTLNARSNQPLGLVYLDLDKFKLINDGFGHREGDKALLFFAREMMETFRDSDLCARTGGDEFTVLLANTSRLGAEKVMNRFRESIAGKYSSDYAIRFSFGVIEYDPARHASIEALMADADRAMYRRKKQEQET